MLILVIGLRSNQGHYRPLIFLERLEYVSNFSIPTFQNLEMDKNVKAAVCPFPNFGKFEKLKSLENMLLVLQLLWATVLSLVHAKENKDNRLAQAVEDEAFLTPAATKAGF